MICIYDKKTLKGSFNNNGLAVLNQCISAEITEELNGGYYLELQYPSNVEKSKYIEEYNIVKADNQLFRIYKIEKTQNESKTIKVYANHIFYDMSYYFIEDVRAENTSPKSAIQKALVGDLSKIYETDSDIVTSATLYMVEMSPVEAIFKIIERWGQGELLRDNFSVKLLNSCGHDTGILIKYGKNIQGVKVTVDTNSVVTKLYPKGVNGIKLPERYINVPNWDSEKYPPFPIIKKVEIKEAEDEATLRIMASEMAEAIGLSSINIQVDFIELSRSKQYEKFKELETLKVGDIVTVRHSEFNIDVKVKVIKIKKDILTGLNTKVELGQPLGNFVDSDNTAKLIQTVSDDLGNQVAQSMSSMLYYANSKSYEVDTSLIQPIYLGVSAVSDTNLTLLLSIYGVASEESTLTIQIQLDNRNISFTPKHKLLLGDNTVGIPLGIPQVTSGGHYIGVFLCVDKGTFSIPLWNLQLMIDGRNLQGGLSAEPPHAEAKEYQGYINISSLVSTAKDNCIIDEVVPLSNNTISDNIDSSISKELESRIKGVTTLVNIEFQEGG